MRRQRKQEQDNLIEIPEEVRIPGTDVILEKGDKVKVQTSKARMKEGAQMSPYSDEIRNWVMVQLGDYWDETINMYYAKPSVEEEIEAASMLISDLERHLESLFGGTIKIRWD